MNIVWHHELSEAEHLGFLLRVQSTASPRRWRWYVTTQAEVKKPYNSKYMAAKATGFSATFEDAQRDAVAMAEAMHKDKGST
jgi:hypothetical protein